MRPLNRPDVHLPVTSMQTYSIKSPTSTHARPATCAEINCAEWRNGWITVLPTGSDNDRLLRRACVGQVDGYRRHFTASHDGGMTTFRFEAGQRCLSTTKHVVALDRPEIYVVRGGDWRGSTGLIRRHTRARDWVEDFALHQDAVVKRFN